MNINTTDNNPEEINDPKKNKSSGEENEADNSWEEIEKQMNAYLDFPIYKKAEHINELAAAIADTLPEEAEAIFHLPEDIRHDAAMLEVKISEIHNGETYFSRMENAVMLKMHAGNLLKHLWLCDLEGFCDKDYIQTLTKEIDKFRILFKDWVKSFKADKYEYESEETDDWGLFP